MLRFLHAVQDVPADGDPIALTIVMAALLAFSLWAIRNKKKKKAKASAPANALPETPKTAAPGTAGSVKTYDVPPKTCAILMAIVADKLGKPLNELRFISIKEVEE